MSISSIYGNNDITIYNAKHIINDYCHIYNKTVLDTVKIGYVVRIGYKVDHQFDDMWKHDNPYVKIIDIDHNNNILGEIMNINHIESNQYPIGMGDRIIFKMENIYEIPYCNNEEYEHNLIAHITEKRVQCSGPLFCVDIEEDSSSDEDSTDGSMIAESSSDVSDSD